jgi:hypothetical protein
LANICVVNVDAIHPSTPPQNKEWSIHSNDQLSALPFCPLLHRAYSHGGHNRCNLKRAHLSNDGRYVLRGADDGTCYLWDAHRGLLLRRFDGQRATPLLGAAATHPGPLLAACLSRTAPYPQVAFASDVAAFLYSYREAPGGGPVLVVEGAGEGEEGGLPDVELLDDSLAEEAGAEERGGMYADEVRWFVWFGLGDGGVSVQVDGRVGGSPTL